MGDMVVQFRGTIYERGYGTIAQKVMRDKTLHPYAKVIYAYLVSFAGQDGSAFPSVNLMMRELGIKSEDTFYKYRKQLTDAGYITIEKGNPDGGKFQNNIYVIETTVKPYPNSSSTAKSSTTKLSTTKSTSMKSGTTTNSALQVSIDHNNQAINNEQESVVVENVRESIESILGVGVKTLTDLPKWIDTYGTDYLVQKATIIANDPPKGGWRNVVGAYRSAVLGNWSETSSTAQLDEGGKASPSHYDFRYHNYYMACEREQYLLYCQSHPQYVEQLVAQYGSRALQDIPGMISGGDDDVALWS
ncbi:MAG: helix-turn-helix domain-containing protein [Alicyclobacillus sp.]|nr:helix-turn-helix domain-containing protein [Alicyclobacillus sp.]